MIERDSTSYLASALFDLTFLEHVVYKRLYCSCPVDDDAIWWNLAINCFRVEILVYYPPEFK